MKYLGKTYDHDEYDIYLEPLGEEITELDKYVFEKVCADKHALFKSTVKYLGEVIDYTKPVFEGGFILRSIDIARVVERVYTIEVEGHFKNDDNMYWVVTFNFPLMYADAESVDIARYWPIELKRRVE